jgi:nucleotide-binding universal stress UspA family protein
MLAVDNQIGLSLDRIVVATDFTSESEKALAYASALAMQYASRLTLAHVIDTSVTTPFPDAVIGLPLDELRHNSAENMERVLNDLGSEGITAQGKTLEDRNPARAVVELSRKVDADLLVVGTHNRHGLRKLLYGSCSEGIFRSADCPVMIIGPNVSPKPLDITFRSIVFATDLQHDAAEKAAIALSFAKDEIADIHICHVIENRAESFTDAFQQQANAERALSNLLPDASCIWHTPKPSVLFGDVDQEVIKAAEAIDADLIVLGARRGMSWLNRFWDGVVEQIVAQAKCPVLTICTN